MFCDVKKHNGFDGAVARRESEAAGEVSEAWADAAPADAAPAEAVPAEEAPAAEETRKRPRSPDPPSGASARAPPARGFVDYDAMWNRALLDGGGGAADCRTW